MQLLLLLLHRPTQGMGEGCCCRCFGMGMGGSRDGAWGRRRHEFSAPSSFDPSFAASIPQKQAIKGGRPRAGILQGKNYKKYYRYELTTMFLNTFCKIVWLLFLFFTFDFSVGHPCSILHRLSSSPIPSFASPTKVRCFVPPPHSLLPPFLPPFLPSWWCSHRHPPSPPPSYTRHRHTLTHSGTERERKEGG